jgi:hypothetical protein
MTEPILSLLGYAQQLSGHKRMATGLPISNPSAISDAYERSFDDLVSAIYRWYGESMRQDRVFLESMASSSQRAELGSFWSHLKDQRHDKQHDGYDRAAAARTWREQAITSDVPGAESDAVLRNALVTELQAALQTLCAIAVRTAKDRQLADSWMQRVAVTPEAEVRNVYSNLGLEAPRNFEYVVRQYEGHPWLRRARTLSDRAQIAQIIVVGIGLPPLSIDYDELLDEFGLLGDSSARSLLVLAHGVEESGHSNASTVSILKAIWPIVRAAA